MSLDFTDEELQAKDAQVYALRKAAQACSDVFQLPISTGYSNLDGEDSTEYRPETRKSQASDKEKHAALTEFIYTLASADEPVRDELAFCTHTVAFGDESVSLHEFSKEQPPQKWNVLAKKLADQVGIDLPAQYDFRQAFAENISTKFDELKKGLKAALKDNKQLREDNKQLRENNQTLEKKQAASLNEVDAISAHVAGEFKELQAQNNALTAAQEGLEERLGHVIAKMTEVGDILFSTQSLLVAQVCGGRYDPDEAPDALAGYAKALQNLRTAFLPDTIEELAREGNDVSGILRESQYADIIDGLRSELEEAKGLTSEQKSVFNRLYDNLLSGAGIDAHHFAKEVLDAKEVDASVPDTTVNGVKDTSNAPGFASRIKPRGGHTNGVSGSRGDGDITP